MDVRQELSLINKHFDRLQKAQGMVVVRYEFIPFGATGSDYDDVYDEGIVGNDGRKYRDGVPIPVIRISEIEDQKRSIPDGRIVLQNVEMFISSKSFREAGIQTPWVYENRLDDIFKWDGRFYSIFDFKVRGNLRGDVYHLVQGNQMYPNQEMVNDPDLVDYLNTEPPWPTGLPNLG